MLSITAREEILQSYNAGDSMGVIGKRLGITRTRVSQILKEFDCKIRSPRQNLLGLRFARLVVIGSAPDRKGCSRWECLCDCGNKIVVPTAWLNNGKTKSCGCFKRDIAVQRFTKHGLCLRGKVTAEYKLYHSAKRRAKKEGLPFNLELADIIIPDFCPVFPHLKLDVNSGCAGDSSPSLDRLIPSLGYIKGNVKVISFRANTIKQDATSAELRQVADWIDRHAIRVSKEAA